MAIEEADEQEKEVLIIGNVIILFFFSGLGFFLAGKNLRPIEEVLEKQKRFTADASHDLRTPLAIMKTDCEVSLKKKTVTNEEFRQVMLSNLEEIDRMSAMVDQLLFLSRHNYTSEQPLELISLDTLVEKMTTTFQSLAKRKNLTLSFVRNTPGNMLGNRLDVERLFLNILKNAIDYTPAGGKIHVSVQTSSSQLKLSIKDTGIGIAQKDLPHITEAFYKADQARSAEYSGAGLGLSIVKKIVTQHHGKLEITSTPGVGTEVIVLLPQLHN